MHVSITSLFAGIFLIMLAVLGHSLWHKELVALFSIVVTLFTGGKVIG